MDQLIVFASYIERFADAHDTALIAAIGLGLTVYQLKRSLRFQRETVATTTYREYLKTSIDKPVLASGKCAKVKELDQWEQYTWYVALLLWASELIIEYAPKDKVWLASIKSELLVHREYLADDEFRNSERGLYSTKLQTIIDGIA
jgi:hypothetical protein